MAQYLAPTKELVLNMIADYVHSIMQSGSILLQGASSGNVTFEAPFAMIPKVLVTPRSVVNKSFWLSNITTAGFTINFTNVEQNLEIDWIAIAR